MWLNCMYNLYKGLVTTQKSLLGGGVLRVDTHPDLAKLMDDTTPILGQNSCEKYSEFNILNCPNTLKKKKNPT